MAPNGELYIADSGHHRILRVDRNGLVRLVAGTITQPYNFDQQAAFAGDGGPAINARFNGPTSLAFGPDGSLYLNDSGNDRIRCIAPSGIITTVAGGGAPADGLGDGGPATSALLIDPEGIAVGRDGRLFIADSGHDRVRVVSPDGVIETAAGGGGSVADGEAAVRSKLNQPQFVAVAPDGTLYLSAISLRGSGGSDICWVDPLGRLSLLAGGRGGIPWNGAMAETAAFQPAGLAVGPDGCLYGISWWWGTVIAKIGIDGLLHHVAGKIFINGTRVRELVCRLPPRAPVRHPSHAGGH